MRKFVTVLMFSTLLGAASAMASSSPEGKGGEQLQQVLGLATLAPASVKRFYESAAEPQWDSDQIEALREAIDASRSHGLNPREYHRERLNSSRLSTWQRDVVATDAYLSLAGHLLGGKLSPGSVEPHWTAKGREKDLVAHLRSALRDDEIGDSLEALAPRQPRYVVLREALAHYRRQAEQGTWEKLDDGPLLKPGARSPRVEALRKRMALENADLADADEPALYDPALVEAVERFQRRSNLQPDGLVGPSTLASLNVSPRQQVDKIRLNMERWRWLPEDLGKRHLRVSIADYQLEAYENGELIHVHDVVVGRPYRQTPVFSAEMKYLVINPWWVTPVSLAKKDLLPKFQKNPEVIQQMGYQIRSPEDKVLDPKSIEWEDYSDQNFPFRVRQKPGAQNALGRIKFIFPNTHDVYLHDTPSRELFEKVRRDFSSGCIRVRKPFDLAAWVLANNPEWTQQRIESLLADKGGSDQETVVSLREPLPVHLLYWTVVADEEAEGDVRFLADVYERDARLLPALNALPPGLDNDA